MNQETPAVIVVDTNILFGALWGGHSARRLMQLWRDGKVRFAVTPKILDEYRLILAKVPRGRQFLEEVREVLEDRERTPLHHLQEIAKLIPEDPSDDVFPACAKAAGAWCIVSNDRHVRETEALTGIPVLSPAQALERIGDDG